ncbi:MAG: GNAT family N-acetyltransferase [Lachnospiraceae bacterium]|nr:GNAT family N-acetyltransferase [Lachnospiraceae bacterium]
MITNEKPDYEINKINLDVTMQYVIAENEDVCVGCVVFNVIDNVLYIRYINVLKKFRSKGIGTNLINKIVDYANENILSGIFLTTTIEQKSKLSFEKFLFKNDFHMTEYDGRIMSFDVDCLKDTYLASLAIDIDDVSKRIHRMDDLPIELKADYKNNIRPNIETEYMLENVEGKYISDLSLAIEKKGHISSYILFSDNYEDLYLNAVYVRKNDTIDLIRLLKYCLSIVGDKYKSYKKMKIRILNYEGYYLFFKLIKGAEVNNEFVVVTYRLL